MSTAKSNAAIRFALNDLREIKRTLRELSGSNDYKPGIRSSMLMDCLNASFDMSAKLRPYFDADLTESETVNEQLSLFIGYLSRTTNLQNEFVESETITNKEIDIQLNDSLGVVEQHATKNLETTLETLKELESMLTHELQSEPDYNPESLHDQ